MTEISEKTATAASKQCSKKTKLLILLGVLAVALIIAVIFHNEILARYVVLASSSNTDSTRNSLLAPVRNGAETTFFEPLFLVAADPDISVSGVPQDIFSKHVKHLTPSRLEQLKLYMKSSNRSVQAAAFCACDSYSKANNNFDLIHEALKDAREDVRAMAIWSLREKNEPEDFDRIVTLLKSDPSPLVRSVACRTLGFFEGEKAVDPLIGALADKDKKVREAAAFSISKVCANKPSLGQKMKNEDLRTKPVSSLTGLINDPDANVRSSVIYALGSIEDKRAVEPLITVLSDPDKEIRKKAIEQLGKLKDEKALEPLVKLLSDPDEVVRYKVVEALGALESFAAVEPLSKLISDPAVNVRRKAIEALGNMQAYDAIELLMEKLKTGEDRHTLSETIEAVGKMGDAARAPALVPYLKDKDLGIRKAAVSALGRIGTLETIPELEKITKDVTADKQLKKDAAAAIEEITKRANKPEESIIR